MSIERRYALLKHNHLHSENTGGLITLTTGSPTLRFQEEGVTADNAVWDFSADGEDLKWRVVSDDLNTATDWLVVNRTGTHVDAIRMICDIFHLDTALFALTDGRSAPGAIPGLALIYVDSADGDLKVKFGDGDTVTIAVNP